MKRVLIVVVLVIAAAVLGLWRTHGGIRQGLSAAVGRSNDSSQGDARDEIRKSFQLQPGARIEVQGINGKVEIETLDTKTAEVYVLRTGNSSAALSRREVVVEQTSDGLMVRARQSRHLGFFEHLFGHEPKEEVTIKAPRQIALSIKGVNGNLTAGDIDGGIQVRGVNGRVELGQAADETEINGINGNITVGFKQLGDRGARMSGVNGNIELRLASGLNAELTTNGLRGSVRSEIPTVTVDQEGHSSRYLAHIGNGGPPIELRGINGNVRLISASVSSTTASNDKKPAKDEKDSTQKTAKTEK
jgi:hypothetical protein